MPRSASLTRAISSFATSFIFLLALTLHGRSTSGSEVPAESGAVLAQSAHVPAQRSSDLPRNATGRSDLFRSSGGNASAGPGVSLSRAVIFPTPGYDDTSAALADVNGDGKLDLVVLSFYLSSNGGSNSAIGVMLGNGDGSFKRPIEYNSAPGSSAVAVADINGDHKPDIVVAVSTGTINVLFGNGDGTFQPAVSYNVGPGQPDAVAIADLNDDGIPDIVVQGWVGGTDGGSAVYVLLGSGGGAFESPVAYDSGSDSSWVTVADVNADSKSDLLIANQCSIAVLLGKGDGTFQPRTEYSACIPGDTPVGVSAVKVADINGDGKVDLVASDQGSGNNGDGSVAVLLGNGDGTFQPAVNYDSGSEFASSVAIADMNSDGRLDIVLTNYWQNSSYPFGSVGVLLGNGDGTFQPAVIFPADGAFTQSVLVADLNGDGQPDVVFMNAGADDGGVMLNTTYPSGFTTTALVSSLSPSIYGQPVTFTASVKGLRSAPPTGEVVFTASGNQIGSAALNGSGLAALTKSNLNADPYSVVALYKGDAHNRKSNSPAVNQVVQEAKSAAALTFWPGSSGQIETFRVKITSPTVAVKGPVTFAVGNQALGTVQLSGGQAVLKTAPSAVGTNTVTVSYLGDSNVAESSAWVTQTFVMPYTATMYLQQMGGSDSAATTFGVGTNPSHFVPYYTGLPNNPNPAGKVEVGTFTVGTIVNFGMFTEWGSSSGWAFSTGFDQASIVAFADVSNSLGLNHAITQQTSTTTWLLHLDDALSYLVDDDNNDILMEIILVPAP